MGNGFPLGVVLRTALRTTLGKLLAVQHSCVKLSPHSKRF
jgi:hypothetical protein